METLLKFLDRIEGQGYGGMADFEIARTEAREAASEIARLKVDLRKASDAERDAIGRTASLAAS